MLAGSHGGSAQPQQAQQRNRTAMFSAPAPASLPAAAAQACYLCSSRAWLCTTGSQLLHGQWCPAEPDVFLCAALQSGRLCIAVPSSEAQPKGIAMGGSSAAGVHYAKPPAAVPLSNQDSCVLLCSLAGCASLCPARRRSPRAWSWAAAAARASSTSSLRPPSPSTMTWRPRGGRPTLPWRACCGR